jgi:RNase P subunit RPR2
MEPLTQKQKDFLANNAHIVLMCPHCNGKMDPGKGTLYRSSGDKRHLALYCERCKKDIPFYWGHDFFFEGVCEANREWERKVLKLFGMEWMQEELDKQT